MPRKRIRRRLIPVSVSEFNTPSVKKLTPALKKGVDCQKLSPEPIPHAEEAADRRADALLSDFGSAARNHRRHRHQRDD